MADYLKTNDFEFQAQVAQAITTLNANLVTLGLVAGDVTPTSTAKTSFDTSLADQVAKAAALDASVNLKKTNRHNLEVLFRALVQRVQHHPGMTDALRGSMGVTVPDRVPTRRGVGTDVPGMIIQLATGGSVILHVGTDPGNEASNSKPAWAIGVNIYRKRTTEATWELVSFVTNSPSIDMVSGPAVNMQYRAAYRGVKESMVGPFSPEQTIAVGS